MSKQLKPLGLSICLVSDFFLPDLGGVELHIYHLALELIERGNRVVVITHSRARRHGVRYLNGGVKVYHLPMVEIYDVVTLPTLVTTLPLMRQIFVRENVQIVHGHQATSCMAMEAIFHAQTMGLRVVFTDHSLFGFTARGEVHVNKLLKIYLADVDGAICVSFTGKENLVIRACLSPHSVHVIPNAVDGSRFWPDASCRPPASERIHVVIVSRLVLRKGVPLLVRIIPRVCEASPNVHFIIGGDGPMRVDLEEMREKHRIEDRVHMLGAIPHSQVPSVLRHGHIFLNASLTEAFCTAIVEAAFCGMYVVASAVGGVPEVLPSHIMKLAPPDAEALSQAVLEAIAELPQKDPDKIHAEVSELYSWSDVAARTEKVYRQCLATPVSRVVERFYSIHSAGSVSGAIYLLLTMLNFAYLWFLDWFYPRKNIEKVPWNQVRAKAFLNWTAVVPDDKKRI